MSANDAVHDVRVLLADLRAQFFEDNDIACTPCEMHLSYNEFDATLCRNFCEKDDMAELASAAAPSLLDRLHEFVNLYKD
jgi:hypothetical protein